MCFDLGKPPPLLPAQLSPPTMLEEATLTLDPSADDFPPPPPPSYTSYNYQSQGGVDDEMESNLPEVVPINPR